MHPKERPNSLGRPATFSPVLRETGLAMSSAGGLLAACSSSTEVATPTGTTGTTGEQTGGTFTVFNYPDYLYKKLLSDFGEKYGVDVQYTAFQNIYSGIQRLASGAVEADVMEMTPDNLTRGRRQADQAAQPRLHPQPEEEHLARARRARSTTSTPTTRCRTRATRPGSPGGPTRSARTSPGCLSPGTSSGRPRTTRARPASLTRSARRSAWRSSARATPTSTRRTRHSSTRRSRT